MDGTAEKVWTEDDYEEARRVVIAHLLEFLRIGDALGKSQMQLAGEFMASFQQACEEAFA